MTVTNYLDAEKEILYWIEYFDYEWIDCGQLINYIMNMYTKQIEDIVNEYVEIMEIKVPNIYVLDWDYIVDKNDDYVLIGEGLYLDIHQLEDNEKTLRKEGLIK